MTPQLIFKLKKIIVCQSGRSYDKKYELTELANQKASFPVLNGERPWKSAHVSVREVLVDSLSTVQNECAN